MGNFIAWDGKTGKIVWSDPEQFSVWGGALATAGGVVFYGTLEGYLKAVDAKTGKELYKFKTPSGIIGNVMTYEHGGRQYVAVLSGVGGWAGIGRGALRKPGNAVTAEEPSDQQDRRHAVSARSAVTPRSRTIRRSAARSPCSRFRAIERPNDSTRIAGVRRMQAKHAPGPFCCSSPLEKQT